MSRYHDMDWVGLRQVAIERGFDPQGNEIHQAIERLRWDDRVQPCGYCKRTAGSDALCTNCWEVTSRLSTFIAGGPQAVEFVRTALGE